MIIELSASGDSFFSLVSSYSLFGKWWVYSRRRQCLFLICHANANRYRWVNRTPFRATQCDVIMMMRV